MAKFTILHRKNQYRVTFIAKYENSIILTSFETIKLSSSFIKNKITTNFKSNTN